MSYTAKWFAARTGSLASKWTQTSAGVWEYHTRRRHLIVTLQGHGMAQIIKTPHLGVRWAITLQGPETGLENMLLRITRR